MSRRILCQSCGDKWKPHPEDVKEGWLYRVHHLSAKRPENHGGRVVTAVSDTPFQLPSLLCDTCGEPIDDGTVVLAVTMFRPEFTVGEWEHEYGTVLPAEAAKLAKVMSKEGP